MTVLSPPHHPFVAQGLPDARLWCAGHTIDDRPALVHAVRVAVVLGEHVPDAPPELIAAVLLHDAPEFAPSDLDLDAALRARYNTEVARITRALQAEHQALETPDPPVDVTDRPAQLASTADKTVALTSLLRRARASADSDAFFAVRPGLLRLLPHTSTPSNTPVAASYRPRCHGSCVPSWTMPPQTYD